MGPDRARSDAEPTRFAGDTSRRELERLRVSARRQALVIATLSEAVSNFHRGVEAMRAENAELRAEGEELRDRLAASPSGTCREDDELVELAIEAGPDAPAMARRVVTTALAERVPEPVLANAQLVMSELVTNSVRHSGIPPGDDVVVRLRMFHDRCRFEVEDPGHDGMIAPQPPDPTTLSGMGLNLVQTLSERWGLVRGPDGPTRVWAQLRCTMPTRARLTVA